MKMRNKGKVHPFNTSSSTTSSSPAQNSSSSNNDVVYPVLKLLPAAIFTLISILSSEDRQVLAYMLSRSEQDKNINNNNKKTRECDQHHHTTSTPPQFDCDCFNCYTSFWFRWDSSPNRELIHQAIEAFEDHDQKTTQLAKKGKRKDKMGRRKVDVLTTSAAVLDSTAEDKVAEEVETTDVAEVVAVAPVEGHRGLARKVLPDVMGIFNSRLWRLWSPNV